MAGGVYPASLVIAGGDCTPTPPWAGVMPPPPCYGPGVAVRNASQLPIKPPTVTTTKRVSHSTPMY